MCGEETLVKPNVDLARLVPEPHEIKRLLRDAIWTLHVSSAGRPGGQQLCFSFGSQHSHQSARDMMARLLFTFVFKYPRVHR